MEVYRANIKFLKSKNPLVTQFLDRFSPEKHTTVMRTIIQAYVEAFNNPKAPIEFPAVEALLDISNEEPTEAVAPEAPSSTKRRIKQRQVEKKGSATSTTAKGLNKNAPKKPSTKTPAPAVIDFAPLATDNEEISLTAEKDPNILAQQEDIFELKEE